MNSKAEFIARLLKIWTDHPDLTFARFIASACRSAPLIINGEIITDGWETFNLTNDADLLTHLEDFYRFGTD